VDIRLDGRVALVTGGSKGIGLAIATRFAASGADVVILARGKEGLAAAQKTIAAAGNRRVLALSCDVADAADLIRTFRDVTVSLGSVDILVNNAGTSRAGKFETVTDEMWQADLDSKLFAAIRLARLALPGMKERRWGRIINVLNTGAKTPRAGSAPTTVSRAAGMALTKVLAGEYAPHNVLVNALLVGFIRADQHIHRAAAEQISIEDYYRRGAANIPLGRVGEAEEFANFACFLASERASFITGTAINVDGGMSPVV
jgi:3-oxoacyl-[acyl-carrier protein] reductase